MWVLNVQKRVHRLRTLEIHSPDLSTILLLISNNRVFEVPKLEFSVLSTLYAQETLTNMPCVDFVGLSTSTVSRVVGNRAYP
jgi:hypothetical protein